MSCDIQPARHNHQPTHQQGTKWAGKAWPKMNKNANFGPNLVVFGQKILIFTGESKSFGTHITEKTPRHLVPNGPKMPIFGQKSQFWAKFTGVSRCFGNHIMEKPPRELVRIVFWSGIISNEPKMPIFGQKFPFPSYGSFSGAHPCFRLFRAIPTSL